MGVQVVLHQHDLARVREVDVGEIAQDLGVVDGRAARRAPHASGMTTST